MKRPHDRFGNYLALNEFRKIIQALSSPCHKPMAQTMYFANLRLMKVIALREEDVDFAYRTIRVASLKRHPQGYEAKMCPELYEALFDYNNQKGERLPQDKFFQTCEGDSLSYRTFSFDLRKASRKIGRRTIVTPSTLRNSLVLSRLYGEFKSSTPNNFCKQNVGPKMDTLSYFEL